MKIHAIMLTNVDGPFDCSQCDWVIEHNESYVTVVHGDNRDNICLLCEEKRTGTIIGEGEIVASK